jgi:hypothetical protein
VNVILYGVKQQYSKKMLDCPLVGVYKSVGHIHKVRQVGSVENEEFAN